MTLRTQVLVHPANPTIRKVERLRNVRLASVKRVGSRHPGSLRVLIPPRRKVTLRMVKYVYLLLAAAVSSQCD